MKMTNRRKALLLLTAVALVMAIGVGGTVAYLSTQSGTVVNTFEPTKVSIDILEKNEANVKKDVKIKNTGDIDAYIRAKIVVTWQDSQGNVYPEMPKAETDYTISLGSDWTLGEDGYYYYNSKVAAENSTNNLIATCAPVASKTPADYNLHVEVLAQAIQADGMGATSAQDAFAKAKESATTNN